MVSRSCYRSDGIGNSTVLDLLLCRIVWVQVRVLNKVGAHLPPSAKIARKVGDFISIVLCNQHKRGTSLQVS